VLHTDGQQEAAEIKQRILEELGGPREKCRKNKEQGVNLAHTSGQTAALVTHPSAQKVKQKETAAGDQMQRLRRKRHQSTCG